MKPLLVLITSFTILFIGLRFIRKRYEPALSGRVAMAIMLFFTASAHFVFTDGMAQMIPDFIPGKRGLVYFTGMLEILGGMGLLITRTYKLVACLLIAFFILILPANIYAAMHHINYQNATLSGPGLAYLWFRVPLQMLFITWLYVFAVKDLKIGLRIPFIN